ncbi:response regulator transcription factor [Fusibacter bizertensis]
MKILIADDELDILELIELCLVPEGYEIVKASDGIEALALFDETMDLVILDIMMPRLDGLKTCIEIRKQSGVPILFLTAKTQDTDQIFGLQLGADDYIKKPFAPAVLVAKVKATLRRVAIDQQNSNYNDPNSDLISYRDLLIDSKAFRVTKADKNVNLTKTEFDILLLLLKHRGQIYSIQRLYETIWNETYFNDSSNTVMVHIKRLRQKIDDRNKENPIIKTVWGVGYKID